GRGETASPPSSAAPVDAPSIVEHASWPWPKPANVRPRQIHADDDLSWSRRAIQNLDDDSTGEANPSGRSSRSERLEESVHRSGERGHGGAGEDYLARILACRLELQGWVFCHLRRFCRNSLVRARDEDPVHVGTLVDDCDGAFGAGA